MPYVWYILGYKINTSIVNNLKDKFKTKAAVSNNDMKNKILKFCNDNQIQLPKIGEDNIRKMNEEIKPELIEVALNNLNKKYAGGSDNIPTKLLINLFKKKTKNINKNSVK